MSLRRKTELDSYQRTDMVHWYNPPASIRTGLESLLGVIFGPFNDRREVQAALDPEKEVFDYHDNEELWLDFIADVGDGWDSTYTMAWMLAQDELKIKRQDSGDTVLLPRAHVLIMGGDEVYPVAKNEEYHARTQRPYESAFPVPPAQGRPHLFAIPGNHDWYDGLTSFLRVFSQNRVIGGWQTRQKRSYFALQLPHRWWLWAVDTQLEADLDRPQREFFQAIAMQRGDRVILCLPKPGWLYAHRDVMNKRGVVQKRRGPHEILAMIEQIIGRQGAVLALTLAGDWHHYCRYESVHGTAQKIASGGGGAYLLGTHTLEHAVPVEERGRRTAFLKTTTYPDHRTSKKLVYRNLGFAWLNRFFSWWILGGFYLLHAWAIQSVDLPTELVSGAGPPNSTFIEHILEIPPGEWLFNGEWLPNALWEILYTYYVVLSEKPAIVLFPLVLWFSLSVFCTPSEYSYRWRGSSRWEIGLQQVVVGGFHTAAHIVLNLCLIWLFAYLNFVWLGRLFERASEWLRILDSWLIALRLVLVSWLQSIVEIIPQWVLTVVSWLAEIITFLFGWIGAGIITIFTWFGLVLAWLLTYNPYLHSWWQRLLYASEMVILGGFAAGTLFGIYLLVTNRLFSFHEDNAFSSLRIPDYKNFLRLHLTPEGLAIYPIGIRKVPRLWRRSNKQTGPRFEPVDRRITPHLIEDPIQISVESVLREEPEIGVGLLFSETMSGWFSMGETDPVRGAELGQKHGSKMAVKLIVVIDNLDRFLCDDEHTGVLRGQVSFPHGLRHPVSARSGGVKFFAPYHFTQRKSITYELTFTSDVHTYLLVGEKLVEDDPGFDIWKDTSTLYARLEQNGQVVGAGILKITFWGVLKNLFSIRPFNAASFREWFQSFGTFLAFFASELWDVYVRRTKGFFLKYTFVSCLVLGGFYLVHGWSIEAASGMTFMEKLAKVSFSEWIPWYWPNAVKTIFRSYQEVYLSAAGILILPLALLVGLVIHRRDDGAHTWLGLGNLEFFRGWFMRFRGVIHALVQLFLNLILVWVFVKINYSWLQMPLDSFSQRLLFLVEMLLVGGTVGGLLYSVFRGVKLVRPYVG